MTQSHDNFCPQCGHRNYQHGKGGCEHIEVAKPDVLDLIREDHIYTDYGRCACGYECQWEYADYLDHLVTVRDEQAEKKPCECTRLHPLMVGVGVT